VTLSGRINVGANSIKSSGTDVAGAAIAAKTANDWTGAENTKTGSRLTVSGVEDLGGGLKAAFDYTAALSPTERGGALTTRRSNVSLMGGFGAVSVGSFDTNALDAVRGFSPTVPGAAGGDFHARMQTGAFANKNDASSVADATGLAGNTSNAVVYQLPAFGALKTSIAIAQQKRVAAAGVTADQKLSGYILGADYTQGPLSFKFGYGAGKVTNEVATAGTWAINAKTGAVEKSADTAVGNFTKVSDVALGASYDLGMAVPYISFETSKGTTQAGFEKSTGTEFGAKFPMGALTPYVSVAMGNLKDEDGKFAKTSAYQLGVNYDLSKRTSFYATLGQDKAKSSRTGAFANYKRTGYSAGVVHMF
jgi:predicted porin